MPALGIEGLGALRGEKGDGGSVGARGEDAADLGDGDAGDFAWETRRGWNGEKEFVVFSAVEGLGEGCGGVDGELSRVNFGGYAGFFAQVGEIGGEAVTDVDCG